MKDSSAITSSRRGSYAALFGVSAGVFLGFTALAVDLSLIRLGAVEIQANADAAAHSAIIRLRGTNDATHSRKMAEQQIRSNQVVGQVPTPKSVQFGTYDEGAFVAGAARTNAVRVQLTSEVPLTFGTLFWGRDTVTVSATATSATRALHTIVVMDITNSWSWQDFEDGRTGAVAVFDQVTATAGPDDRIGMVVFTGQFGTEFTPLMPVADALAANVRDDWANMRTASKAGTPNGYDGGCSLHSGSSENDFSTPSGGCYPNMPREYRDEYGTDHVVGIQMAATMFTEHTDPSVYRAAIMLTDGEPNGTGPHAQRGSDGYTEARWRATFAGTRRSKDAVITESAAWGKTAWDNDEIHIWTVSYKATADWMHDVAQGDGMHIRAARSEDLAPIFSDIVESLPVALVE